jgi:glutathionylspermidine synthase
MFKNIVLLYSVLQKRMEKNIFTKERTTNDYCQDLNFMLSENLYDLSSSIDNDASIIKNFFKLYSFEKNKIINTLKDERYLSINFSNLTARGRHENILGTIEFRQLQGTLDYNEFSFWINFIYNMVYYSQDKQFKRIIDIISDELLTPSKKLDKIFYKISSKLVDDDNKSRFKSEFEALLDEKNSKRKEIAKKVFYKKYAESFI